MQTGKMALAEAQGLRDDGTPVYVLIRAFPLPQERGKPTGFIEVVEDITVVKKAAEEKRRLEETVQHAQKLESLGVLAGGIAHDFNNLLMGILGNTDLALMKMPPESPARPYVERTATATERAADLANQMLAYSGKGRFVVQPVSLSTLVKEMAHLLQTVISKKATLKLNLEAELPLVEADLTQMRQVMMNVITNGSDALEGESGVVAVQTGVMEVDASYLAHAHVFEELPSGKYVFLEVSDTGGGMDKATQERIFDPFFTTKDTGRGLGLAAVQGIVRGHKGAIRLYSEVGKGTTVKILLPALPDSVKRAQPDLPGSIVGVETEAAGQLVLVADDHEDVRSVAAAMLEAAGYRVITAVDGRDALDIFVERGDEIGLVILDMTMPRMGGEEAFREIRRIRADVPVLLSSGYNEQEAISHFAGKGLAGFIQKPYRTATLLEKTKHALSLRLPSE
jgi:signal transduction histidine kinase